MQVLKSRSGITILLRRVPGNLVSARYVVNCGSIDELVSKEFGLCHALEHMFYGGTKKRDWDQIDTDFRLLGAYSNAATGHNRTDYEMLVPKENLAGAFEVAADLMYNSTFPVERWVGVEQPAIVNEVMSMTNSPDWVLENDATTHALGGELNYHHPGGLIQSVRDATVEDLLVFKERFYCGDNVFVAISGDLTAEEVLEIVDRYDQWDPRTPEARVLKTLPFDYERGVVAEVGCDQRLIHMLKPLRKTLDDREIFASQIMAGALNHHLMNEIRNKRGLCYDIHVDLFRDLPESDYLAISTAVEDDDAQERTIEELAKILPEFVEKGLDDLNIQKSRMDGYRELLSIENVPDAHTLWMATNWLLGKTSDPLTLANTYIKDLPNDFIREVSRELVSGEFKITTLEGVEDCEGCEECDAD